MSFPCVVIIAESARSPRALQRQPDDAGTPMGQRSIGTAFEEERAQPALYSDPSCAGIASKLPWYNMATGSLWIKEVGCHSLLRVASIHAKFGRTVRALRAKAGYSQESFADAIHIHRTSMGTLERGDGNPTLETILKIARGLDVSLTELFLAVEKDTA